MAYTIDELRPQHNGERRMLARHNAAVMALLEKVSDLGCATALKAEFLRWYGQERLSRGIWRDLEDKWAEELEEKVPLLWGDSGDNIVLVYGEGVTCAEGSWLQPISKLASRPA